MADELPGGLPTGIGNDKQALQATAFIRQQPWYQQWLASQGLPPEGPGNGVKLNDSQRAQLMALSLKNGIGLNHKYDSIDENGMIAEEHHKLKKVAIAAAIAGLALTGFGAAGIGPLAGALGGASAAAGGAGTAAATTGGTLASTTIGTGFIPAIAGGTGLAAGTGAGIAGAAGAAGLAGAAGGAAPLATTAIPGALGVTGGSASGALGAGIVPATTSSLGAAGSAGAMGGASTLSKVASLAGKTQQGVNGASDILGAAGAGVGNATTAAGNNRLTAGELALKAQQLTNQTTQTNTQGQQAFEGELMARAKQEEGERTDALKNIYRQSYATNRTPGPYNERGLTPYSPEYLTALKDLTTQGSEKLKTKGKYDTSAMPELAPYTPSSASFDPKQFMDEYGQPSTLEKVGGWLSPTLTTLGTVAKYWK